MHVRAQCANNLRWHECRTSQACHIHNIFITRQAAAGAGAVQLGVSFLCHGVNKRIRSWHKAGYREGRGNTLRMRLRMRDWARARARWVWEWVTMATVSQIVGYLHWELLNRTNWVALHGVECISMCCQAKPSRAEPSSSIPHSRSARGCAP